MSLQYKAPVNQGLRPRVSENNTDWTTPFLNYTLVQNSDNQGERWNNSLDVIYDYKPRKGEELNARLSYTDGSNNDVLIFIQDTVLNLDKLPSDKYARTDLAISGSLTAS